MAVAVAAEANEAIHTGMPVELAFDDVSEEVTLPRFRPREAPE